MQVRLRQFPDIYFPPSKTIDGLFVLSSREARRWRFPATYIYIFFSFGNYPALSYPLQYHCRGDVLLDADMLYFEYRDPNYVLSPSKHSHTFANRSSDAICY